MFMNELTKHQVSCYALYRFFKNENLSQLIPPLLKVKMDLQIKCEHLFDKCDRFFNTDISKIVDSTKHFKCHCSCFCTIAEKLIVSPKMRAAPDSVLLNPIVSG